MLIPSESPDGVVGGEYERVFTAHSQLLNGKCISDELRFCTLVCVGTRARPADGPQPLTVVYHSAAPCAAVVAHTRKVSEVELSMCIRAPADQPFRRLDDGVVAPSPDSEQRRVGGEEEVGCGEVG